jgi:catechol 2,3-dioxygenase-like lactoylglutathione lyase family enzyme
MSRLYHVGLTVRDLARSVSFYRDVAGMQQESLHGFKSPQFDLLTGNPGADLKVAVLKTGPFMLQLLEYVAGGGGPLDLHHNNVGSPHLSFFVPDAEAKFREVQAREDVKITSPLVEIKAGRRSFYVVDPDGVPVEFIEPPADRRSN